MVTIIVAEQVNHRVQELSRQGGYLRHFGGFGSLDHQLDYPTGLSIDSDGNIIVADRNNKLIKIFSADGQFLNKLSTEGSVTESYHCIQLNNHLVVSDRGDHCIKCFDRKGKFLYKFGKMGNADGEFNKPDCLSMDKAGHHLMVCDAGNNRIQVFDLSGKFIAKFGTKGRGIGEFNWPVSAAVLSDGKIVVSALANSRIQIFE